MIKGPIKWDKGNTYDHQLLSMVGVKYQDSLYYVNIGYWWSVDSQRAVKVTNDWGRLTVVFRYM